MKVDPRLTIGLALAGALLVSLQRRAFATQQSCTDNPYEACLEFPSQCDDGDAMSICVTVSNEACHWGNIEAAECTDTGSCFPNDGVLCYHS